MNEDNFVLRELRAAELPSRCLWTCPAPIAASSSSLLGDIGRGKSSPSVNVSSETSTGAGALKKLQLRSTSLVIELMLAPRTTSSSFPSHLATYFGGELTLQKSIRPPANAFRIWVHQLLNPENTVEVTHFSFSNCFCV